ncbi:VOC family protein [Deinococcus yavapaiensis]|uniref:Glyoxalase/bleomycin resistance protein/dioxygenase superfamily protein n=1 Tax=Deinococcus yavapaiensis KR-236 TaxID=694435 RepID=A0A318S1Z0_9DEIO|nr:VOC family protein [Deinococcus yavapaiensis]PYE49379.1 glyoxalase/bleomycin resistance protein/dioxygenase superfamily protein [Deinococcus yavapaiensis KR-236]
MNPPSELRLVLAASDFDAAVRLFRDGLGLHVVEGWNDPNGRGLVLDVGRATLELLDTPQARRIDAVESPGIASGPVRVALNVDDVEGVAARLAAHGATPLAPPVDTPWGHHNQRLVTPDDLHVTLFHPEVVLP